MRTFLLRLIAPALLAGLPAVSIAATTPAPATPASMFTGVDGTSSTIFQHGQSSFSGIGLRARLAPFSVPDLEVMPGLEYWRNTSSISVYDIHSERSDATLGVDARYRFPAPNWRPYAGVGFGIHFLSSKVDASPLGVNDAKHSIMKGAVSVLGGVTFPLAGKFETFLEGKYHAVSDYEQFKLSWGLSFNAR